MSSSLSPNVESTHRDGLQHLLGTLEVDTFLDEYLGEQMLHSSGSTDRWAELFSWNDLNALLNRGTEPPPMVRLVRRGQPVKAVEYMHERGGRTILDPVRCQRQMAAGATMIVQLPVGISPSLDRLMAALKGDLKAEAYADIVVTTASVPGLKLHWDPYECFNLQLAGQKEWLVTRPARLYPLRHTKYFPNRSDIMDSPTPDGPPTWSCLMQPGDMIYLPRGWWHGVTPRTVPCMHLSIAVDIPTVSDFFNWCADVIKQHDAARRPLPCWGSSDTRKTAAARALDLIAATLSANTLDAYLAQTLDDARPSAPFSLPAAARSGEAVLTPGTRLRLQQRSLTYRVEDGHVRVAWAADTLEFTDRVLPVLQRLNECGSCTLAELSDGCPALLVRAFVLTLLAAGIVSIVDHSLLAEMAE